MTVKTTECGATSTQASQAGYDLVVIGAGSAGFAAAIAAAEQGAEVALVGHGTLGGTCVNIGCLPSKTLIRAAQALHDSRAAVRFAGLHAAAELEDWPALVQQKDALVSNLRRERYADLLSAYDSIHYIESKAQLVQGGVVIDGVLLRANRVIIASGARPAMPPIPGVTDVEVLTSTSALSLEKLPRSLLVLGGGYIGAELAQMFARMGVRVTVVCRSRLLPAAEPEISEALSRYFQEEGIALDCGITYRRLRSTDHGVALVVAKDNCERVLEAERLLVATGRKPNVEDLGLETLGIAQANNGAIELDDYMQTTRPGIYGAGDVSTKDQFVYMAAYGAKIAAQNALSGNTRRYDRSAMPAVVFTDPQVASVGETEAAARANDLDVETSVLPLHQVSRAIAARDTRGLIKLVRDRRSERLLGAHLLAPEGADAIQTAALVIKHGLTSRDLAEMIFPYLTTAEGLKLAAQAFEKDVAKLSCCAG